MPFQWWSPGLANVGPSVLSPRQAETLLVDTSISFIKSRVPSSPQHVLGYKACVVGVRDGVEVNGRATSSQSTAVDASKTSITP
nr:hypothetical protein BgiMline_012697 [Biomphalaria glabrata]